ncbi:DUF4199 domain-containing protein [Chitinophaga niabensis]|uniref:DUF4199 domain-containing protein n=1 Tax=Chitinophaga niabensis TaxID=536979 RepID=A0A1N6ES35_9BACT|nr:DUF4199 domain-containing protein [Chitinophaga niabensis]SIN85761.1 Protein of unknown function [Chitinophaga niabensis]
MENKNHITYGLIGTAICVVLFLSQWFAKVAPDNAAFKWGSVLILGIIIILSCINFSKINGGDVTFGQVFANGFKTTAVITVLFTLVYIIFYLLVPSYKESMIEFSTKQQLDAGATADQVAAGREWMEKYFLVVAVGGIVFLDLLIGVVASLIGAAIVKRKK